MVQYVRTMAGTAQEQLSKELGPGFEDLDLRDLNPKTFVQKHLLDDVDPIIADVKKEITDVAHGRRFLERRDSGDQRGQGRQPGRSARPDGGADADPRPAC